MAHVFFLLSQGVSLPKAQNKFENFLKHGYRVSDAKVQYMFRVLAFIRLSESVVFYSQSTLQSKGT